jgi:hypothetical protein
VQERTHKRHRSNSEYSNTAIKRTGIDPGLTSISYQNQYIYHKAPSILQTPSGVLRVAPSSVSSPSQPAGDNFYLFTQQPQQTPQPPSTASWNSTPEQNIQPFAEGFERLPTNDISLPTNMYCPESLCLPVRDKYFNFNRSPRQWTEGFASLVPFRPASTNQPNLSKWLFLIKSFDANTLADGNLYPLEKSEDGTSISEKPYIPTPGTNSYSFEPYSDDPQTHMQRPTMEEQVSQLIPEMILMEC